MHKHSRHIGNYIVDSEKYLLTLDMGANINQYTIKRLVKFAYSLKQDEDWVITRVWEEFLREEKKHMTEELRETYFAEYQKYFRENSSASAREKAEDILMVRHFSGYEKQIQLAEHYLHTA
mgnify:CR=1 FL=1